MAALIIGPEQKEAIGKLVELASQNVLDATKGTTQEAIQGLREFMGNLSIALPVGYLVTYSHEKHPPGAVVKHISISVDRAGGGAWPWTPNEQAVLMIMKAFGMENFKTVPSKIWVERVDFDFAAINVVQELT